MVVVVVVVLVANVHCVQTNISISVTICPSVAKIRQLADFPLPVRWLVVDLVVACN